MKPKYFFVFLLLSYFYSCAPLLTPKTIYYCSLEDESEAKWENGSAIIKKDVDSSISSYLKYDRSDFNYHYFKFGIVNYSDNDILVDPINMFVSASKYDGTNFSYNVVDPEEYIQFLRYKGELARTEAENEVIRQQNASTVMAVTLVGVVLATATIAAIDDHNKNKNRNVSDNSMFSNSARRRASRAMCNNSVILLPPPNPGPTMEQKKDMKIHQINEAQAKEEEQIGTLFRKTTLSKNQSNEGFLLVPIDGSIKNPFSLNIQINDSVTFQYLYNLKLYQPTTPSSSSY